MMITRDKVFKCLDNDYKGKTKSEYLKHLEELYQYVLNRNQGEDNLKAQYIKEYIEKFKAVN